MKALSVYVHIPFCTVKCGYCDFNAYAGMDALKSGYREALLSEIARYEALAEGYEVVSIGFGGGTPGEVPPEHIGDVIRAVRETWRVAPDEVTLEANPGTSSTEYLTALRTYGVTRVSLGAQSFDAAQLQFLDRIHSVEAIGASVHAARAAGLSSVNLDLIYGLPGQSLEHWRAQLRKALTLKPDHLSCYALTVEDGTPLHRRVESGEVEMPDGDSLADMYEAAEALLNDAGFHHYELSNWAVPGHESRHNVAYWSDREYVGIGAGAHGYLGGQRYENVAHPRAYIAAALGPGQDRPVATTHDLTIENTVADWLGLRLRLVDGFEPVAFEERFGLELDVVAGPPLRAAGDAGWLEWTGERLRLTPAGRLLHGEIVVRIIDHLDRHPVVPAAHAHP